MTARSKESAPTKGQRATHCACPQSIVLYKNSPDSCNFVYAIGRLACMRSQFGRFRTACNGCCGAFARKPIALRNRLYIGRKSGGLALKLVVTEKNIAAQKIADLLGIKKPKADKVYNTPVYRFELDGEEW